MSRGLKCVVNHYVTGLWNDVKTMLRSYDRNCAICCTLDCIVLAFFNQ